MSYGQGRQATGGQRGAQAGSRCQWPLDGIRSAPRRAGVRKGWGAAPRAAEEGVERVPGTPAPAAKHAATRRGAGQSGPGTHQEAGRVLARDEKASRKAQPQNAASIELDIERERQAAGRERDRCALMR